MSDDASIDDSAAPPPTKTLARGLRLACWSIRAAALIWWIWTLAMATLLWGDRETMVGRWVKLYELAPASVSDRGYAGAFGLVFVAAAASAVMVYFLWRLTQCYLDGRVFTVEAARNLRRVALAGFAATAVGVLARPIQVWLISVDLFGKLPLYAWLQPPDLLYLLICGFLLALAVIFEAAAEIAEDSASIV
jgi:uncharacterized membrane protein